MMVSVKELPPTTTSVCLLVLLGSVWCCQGSLDKPNIVIFLADDMGFGDLQPFGNPLSRTPYINALERNGLKFTQFYSAAPKCSPSRAGLLTGRYPVRSGIWGINNTGDFNQVMTEGLPHWELTIPEMLAKQGYKSALIGKWHLGIGRDREFLPLHQGFDDFFGLGISHVDCPCDKCFYPHDYCDTESCIDYHAPCQLILGDKIIEQPVNLILLAERQARAARSLIQKYSCARTPFFLMYSFFHPHVPHFAGKRYRNSTLGGDYTDSLAELDWQVGEVMDELKKSEVIDNTLIIVTSDNGPELALMELGGFSGVMKCGKGSTYEGGSRVPTIAYWKDRIPSGISTELLSHLDIWPTLRSLSGSSPDDFDVTLDGFDFSDVLFRNGTSQRSSMLYYPKVPSPDVGPYAVRNKRYKAHFITPTSCGDSCTNGTCEVTELDPPLLFDLLIDSEERDDLRDLQESTKIIQEMTILWEKESDKVNFTRSVLMDTDESVQLCCNSGCEPFPSCCHCPSNYTNEMFPIMINCELLPLEANDHNYSNKGIC